MKAFARLLDRYPFISPVLKWIKRIVFAAGCFFLLLLVLAFTTLPFWMYYDLGVAEAKIHTPPQVILFMGGSGWPSESNLIRAYFTTVAAQTYPGAKVLVALPGNIRDTSSSIYRLRHYLIEEGLDSSRILTEIRGTNTRGQCLNIAAMLDPSTPLLVISSPEHLKRSVLCLRKTGFRDVSGFPSFETPNETELVFKVKKLGGRELPVEFVSDNLQLRYQFWTHLKYEVIVIREYLALGYYKLKGWI